MDRPGFLWLSDAGEDAWLAIGATVGALARVSLASVARTWPGTLGRAGPCARHPLRRRQEFVVLARARWDVSGVDPSAVAVAQARFGDRVRQGDVVSMAYPDSTFDTVLFSHVLEHLHGPQALLKEVWRILEWTAVS